MSDAPTHPPNRENARRRHEIADHFRNQFLESAVLPVRHIDPVVVDVWLKNEPLVIEINPVGLSDPCLLSNPEMEHCEKPLFQVVEVV
jgi:hypothetical protein